MQTSMRTFVQTSMQTSMQTFMRTSVQTSMRTSMPRGDSIHADIHASIHALMRRRQLSIAACRALTRWRQLRIAARSESCTVSRRGSHRRLPAAAAAAIASTAATTLAAAASAAAAFAAAATTTRIGRRVRLRAVFYTPCRVIAVLLRSLGLALFVRRSALQYGRPRPPLPVWHLDKQHRRRTRVRQDNGLCQRDGGRMQVPLRNELSRAAPLHHALKGECERQPREGSRVVPLEALRAKPSQSTRHDLVERCLGTGLVRALCMCAHTSRPPLTLLLLRENFRQ